MTTVKKISILLILGFACAQIFAQENEAVPRFGLGGGSFLSGGSMNSGGSADFSFLLFHKNVLDIRNHIVFRGGSFSEGGIMMLLEKISVGGMITGKWRSYGYIEGGIGITANETKKFFEQPFTYSFGGGGGTDLFLWDNLSIFFEAGGLFIVTDRKWINGGIFTIGWKGWF